MKFNAKSILKRIGIFSLIVSMCISSVGFASLADYSENQEIIEDGISLDSFIETDDFLSMNDKLSILKEYEDNSRLDMVVASASNVTNTINVVTTAAELEETINMAEDGDVIEIGNDIYLDDVITLDKSITLQSSINTNKVSIYAANKKRHFIVEGDIIYFSFQDIVLDGNNMSGGIESAANHIIISNANISKCRYTSTKSPQGGGIGAKGKLTIIDSIVEKNYANTGGGIYALSTITIENSDIVANETLQNGGGIFASGDINITNSNISDNIANTPNFSNRGGGLYTVNQGDVYIENSTISNNIANKHGGGIYIESTGNIKIYSTLIAGNIANEFGGGGVYVKSCDAIDITNSIFSENSNKMEGSGSGCGGGIAIMGGVAYISDSKFIDNVSKYGGGIYTREADIHILNCELSNNNVRFYGGAIYTHLVSGKKLLIENSNIYENQTGNGKGGSVSGGLGGGICAYGDEQSSMVISNCRIINNFASSGGGGIESNYRGFIQICNNSVVKNNYAIDAYLVTDEETKKMHNQMIDETVTWTQGFEYIYNNLDVHYLSDEKTEFCKVLVTELFEEYEETETIYVKKNANFYHEFDIPIGYEAIIEGVSDKYINFNHINIPSVSGDYTIKITYIPILEDDTHTVTLITQYLDGIQPDESTSYQVRSGESFEETYNALEGYEFAGISLRSAYPLVDGDAQTVYIDSVTDDYTITIKLARKSQTVKITTQYLDEILPNETKSYSVLYGDNFAESYEALEGYTFVGISVRSYPYVDGDLQMVYIDEVKENYEIIIKLDRAEYNVTITVQYPEGTIDNQIFAYSVLYGDSFEEFFNVESGYRIAAIQTEKGVDVDFQKQIVEIDSVKKDMKVTIICR